MMKKLFVLLAVITGVSCANATTLTNLPESNYGTDGWQGYKIHSEDNISARIEYAVYDTQATGFDFVTVGTGRYIYAYQIFTNDATGYTAVASFDIPGVNTTNLSGIGTEDDLTGDAILATNDGLALLWSFDKDTLVGGTHSFFLVFSSNAGPIAGTYVIAPQKTDDFPTPDEKENPVPEPMTIMFVALGAAGLLRKYRRS